jgi:hypothetical protein
MKEDFSFDSYFDGFTVADWAKCVASMPNDESRYVYALILSRDGLRVPFYIRQTGRLVGRMGDYQYRHFEACTDFRVGEAIKYLSETKQYRIEVRFRQSDDPRQEERRHIRELLLAGFPLLNHLAAYDYKVANREEEVTCPQNLIHS